MEHGRFEYSPIARRPKRAMPGNARVALWCVVNVEHFVWGGPGMPMTPMTAGLTPDVLNYAWRDYGARVGVWRLMELFARQGVPVTAALNADVCARYPQIVEEGAKLGWDWMAHGPNNSMLFTGMPEEAEKPIIDGVLQTITAATGKKPRGWLGPALTETNATLDLLAEAGVEYVADWCNDELPYDIKTRAGSIAALPYTLEIGDIPIFLQHGASGEDFYNILIDQFEMLYEEGATRPRVMSIALHPFIAGHPFRARHLERALAYIKQREGVWLANGADLIDWHKSASAQG